MMFNAIEFIETKRDGGHHKQEEISSFVDAVMDDKIADYQLSAWLMAAFLNGLDDEEIMFLTEALANSGDVLHYPAEQKIIDKHSTGGVGDKTTLVLVPLVASCGAKISKLSGPGLGYTGGTVDKLKSIPGMQLSLTNDQFRKQVSSIGCAISGHSLNLAPAEGKFYKMRDVTGTVPSIPLITTSIISKKLAGGAYGYLFDVKSGSGAFMRNTEEAVQLAQKLVLTSKKLGKSCTAIITDMEQPLGEWIGNSAEVAEALQVLKGLGPADTRELCINLGGYMLAMAGSSSTDEEGFAMCAKALDDGSALKKFRELIEAQGGNSLVVEEPEKILPSADFIYSIRADRGGCISRMDAMSIGEGLRALGGGRLRKEDTIDPAVAIKICAKTGDKVNAGDKVIEVHYNLEEQLNAALPHITRCWSVADHADKRKLIIERVYY
jgi:pyrimidine-nucleoside phosphorylase